MICDLAKSHTLIKQLNNHLELSKKHSVQWVFTFLCASGKNQCLQQARDFDILFTLQLLHTAQFKVFSNILQSQ